MKFFSRCIDSMLVDVYEDAIKRVKLRRALNRIKKALNYILKTQEVPSDLNQLTWQVHAELEKQDALEDVDMNLIGSVVDKCFLLKERGISVGQDLTTFIVNVEKQIERITETESTLESTPN